MGCSYPCSSTMEQNFGLILEWMSTRSRMAPMMRSGACNKFYVWVVCLTSWISRTRVRIHFGTQIQIDKHSQIHPKYDALMSLPCICSCQSRMRYNKLKWVIVFYTLPDDSLFIRPSTVQFPMRWNHIFYSNNSTNNELRKQQYM